MTCLSKDIIVAGVCVFRGEKEKQLNENNLSVGGWWKKKSSYRKANQATC